MKIQSFAVLFILAIVAMSGCSNVSDKLRADPAKPSGYLDATVEMKEQRDRYPFDMVWVSDDWRQNRDKYTNVILPPVNTDYLQNMDWWQRQSAVTQESMKNDARQVANYLHEQLVKKITDDPNHRLSVVFAPGPDTIIAEFALVELVPSKAFFNAAATAAGFIIPGAGVVSTAGKGSVAIEGRIRDSSTGAVLAQFADREVNKPALMDVAGMTWYDGSKDNINDWANQFGKLMNTPLSEKVDDALPFAVVTW